MRHTFSYQLAQWKRAALLKDDERAAIRFDGRSGRTVEQIADTYNVPSDFVRALCGWRSVHDDEATAATRLG